MDFSFIIPAYNETDNIESTISAIRKHTPENYQYEIIVVDHGSTDNTAELAKTCGATVLSHPEGTIANLRNHGVKHCSGKLLIFLDADIRLTQGWANNIVPVATALIAGERVLTGSWCSISDNPNRLEKYWFKPLQRGDNSHINSGHLIIARLLFDELNGFDEKLETGEDYDISMRAKAANIKLIDNVKLKVIHDGYPENILAFAKREYWHGRGDVASFATILQSRVALVALLFITLHIVLFALILSGNVSASLIVLAAIAGIVVAIAGIKYRGESILTILINSSIYYVYFWARGLSILSCLNNRNLHKRTR